MERGDGALLRRNRQHQKGRPDKDNPAHWSAFGQAVLMVLIQIGGLGVITVGASFSLLSGRRIESGDGMKNGFPYPGNAEIPAENREHTKRADSFYHQRGTDHKACQPHNAAPDRCGRHRLSDMG